LHLRHEHSGCDGPADAAGVAMPPCRALAGALAAGERAGRRRPPCAAEPPRSPARAAAGDYCAAPLSLGQQCGGALGFLAYNCTNGKVCKDAPWSGCACGAGASCTRSSNYCFKCAANGAPVSSYLVQPEASAAALSSAPTTICPATTANGSTAYDWACVLRASMRFYDAQRSGKLPASLNISWRGDTQLKDAAPNGASLVGGFYDAGGERRDGSRARPCPPPPRRCRPPPAALPAAARPAGSRQAAGRASEGGAEAPPPGTPPASSGPKPLAHWPHPPPPPPQTWSSLPSLPPRPSPPWPGACWSSGRAT
jgi:hypothetical protein